MSVPVKAKYQELVRVEVPHAYEVSQQMGKLYFSVPVDRAEALRLALDDALLEREGKK